MIVKTSFADIYLFNFVTTGEQVPDSVHNREDQMEGCLVVLDELWETQFELFVFI